MFFGLVQPMSKMVKFPVSHKSFNAATLVIISMDTPNPKKCRLKFFILKLWLHLNSLALRRSRWHQWIRVFPSGRGQKSHCLKRLQLFFYLGQSLLSIHLRDWCNNGCWRCRWIRLFHNRSFSWRHWRLPQLGCCWSSNKTRSMFHLIFQCLQGKFKNQNYTLIGCQFDHVLVWSCQ